MTNPTTADPVDDAAPSIGARVGRGLRWSIVGLLVTKLGSFVISLVLARLLTPSDFGVFAVAMALTAFLMHVNDVGIIAAVIQWPGRTEDIAGTAAIMAVAFSSTVYAVVFVTAPAFADLAGQPDATWVIRLLASVIVIDGITAVRSGSLMRNFQQDRLTAANALGFLVQAPLSIVLAAEGGGAYSFAASQVAGAAVTGVFVFRFAAVRVGKGFDRAIAAKLLRFGVPLAVSLGVEAILLNADYVIVGRVLGGAALGFYLLAFNVASWVPGVVTAGIRYVSIAGFSRLAEEDAGALGRGVQRTLPLLITTMLPLAVVVCALPDDIVAGLYGSKWAPAAAALRFLILLLVGRVLTSFAFDVLTSAGATRSALALNAGWAVVLLPALWIGTHADGIRGTAIAHAVVALLVAVPLAAVLLQRCGIDIPAVWSSLGRPALAGLACAAVCIGGVALLDAPAWDELVGIGGTALIVYVAIALPPSARAALLVRTRASARRLRAADRIGGSIDEA